MPEPTVIFKTRQNDFREVVDHESCQLPLSAAETSSFSWEQLNELLLTASALVESRRDLRVELDAKLDKLERRIDELHAAALVRGEQLAEIRGMLSVLTNNKTPGKSLEISATEQVVRKATRTRKKV